LSTLEILYAIPISLCFILLYFRKRTWVKSKTTLILLFALALISTVGYLTLNPDLPGQLFWGLTTPFIFQLSNKTASQISWKIHGRELYLWLRGSEDIDNTKLSGGSHVKGSDRILSLTLLILVILLPLIPTLLK